jgi:neutral trehalase
MNDAQYEHEDIMRAAAINRGWYVDEEGIWRHEDHPKYGYFDVEELCEDWSLTS